MSKKKMMQVGGAIVVVAVLYYLYKRSNGKVPDPNEDLPMGVAATFKQDRMLWHPKKAPASGKGYVDAGMMARGMEQ